jgi:hypothetical protein
MARMAIASRSDRVTGTRSGTPWPGDQETNMARLQKRLWQIGAVLAPLMAVALSLEAGRRWF